MEEDNVAIPGLSTSDVSPTPRKRVRKNVLNPDLAAALDVQKLATKWLPYCWLQLPLCSVMMILNSLLIEVSFKSSAPLTVHWDDRLLPQITRK